MVTLHRLDQNGLPIEDRVAIPADEIKQVHEGKGGVTIVTTPFGRLAVQETLEDVVNAVESERGE